jgi:hypothetical protein
VFDGVMPQEYPKFVDVILHDVLAMKPAQNGLKIGHPYCPEMWKGFNFNILLCGRKQYDVISIRDG